LKSINEKIGDKMSDEEMAAELGDERFPMVDIFGDWNDAFANDEMEGNDLRRSDADDYTPEAFDQYLTAEIVADRGGELLRGTVKSRKRDFDGKHIGSSNPNPLLDTERVSCVF
jgi:hypothetical protein